MQAKTRRAVETRWLYRAEGVALSANKFANTQRDMAYLNRLALRIWNAEAPGRKFPSIAAGKGVRHGNQLLSFCLGYSEIVLARGQRNVLVLLHELTHALGPCTHGKKFVRTHFYLLQKYARFSWALLQGVAAERGIVLD